MSKMLFADHFNQYFEIILANTKALKETSYHLRYQVYSEEFGWLQQDSNKMEVDEFDHYSVPLLLKHRRTNQYAGTLRLVIPPPHAPESNLPFEIAYSKYLWKHVVDPSKLERGSFGEISRLAIPKNFRRRKGEEKAPEGNIENNPLTNFDEDEKRFFPFIGIGLYLGLTATIAACNQPQSFGVFETQLAARFNLLGFSCIQCSDEIEHYGKRALYYFRNEDLSFKNNPQIHELYETIEKSINRQLLLYPYNLDIL